MTTEPTTKAIAERRTYLARTYKLEPEQVDVLRNAICIGATDVELEFFLATAKRVDLDPFARQIWFIKRRQKRIDSRGNEEWIDVGRPETGIDGYRSIAERSGQYRGQDPIEWCGKDGRWADVWLSDEFPAAARASVYREGFVRPLVAVATFREYAAVHPKSKDLVGMWKKMPANQLSKCAEALALRRAWPQNLSGLVTAEEMEHVDAEASGSYSAPAKPIEQKATPAIESRKESTTTIVDQAPATAKQGAPVEPASTAKTTGRALLETLAIDVVAEIDEMLHEISEATDVAQISNIGNACSKARKGSSDRERAIMEIVWPKFQEQYRALGGGTKKASAK